MVKHKIKRLVDLGVTQAAIANGTGVSKNIICRWLGDQRDLKEENERKIAAWLEEFKQQVAEL